MNIPDQPEEPPRHVDKGKGRAQEPTERTPLLGSSSAVEHGAIVPANNRRRLRSKLATVFLVSLSTCILVFVLVALLAWSYASRASNLDPDDIINNDLVVAGPDRVDVLNVTEGGVWLNVRGRIGVDAGRAIEVDTDPDDGLLRDIWKTIGRWGVRTLDTVSVNMSTIKITPEYNTSMALLSLDMPPIELPLSVDPPKDLSWLTPVSIPVYIRLTSDNGLILQFLKESWHRGAFSVRADVGQATIRGGSLNSASWRNKFYGKLSNIRTSIHMKLPYIPGFPHPSKDLPSISKFITLKSFNVSSEPNTLVLHATASLLNPTGQDFNLSVPSLPFVISVPTTTLDEASIPVASVSNSPLDSLTHPNITLLVAGSVLPISTRSFPSISNVVTRYLSGEANDVLVSSPLLPWLDVQAEFPAPNPKPQLLRNVTIQNMKIKPTGSLFLASGTVLGRLVLPAGMHLGLDITRVLPDLLVFDGEVPPSEDTSLSVSASSTYPVPRRPKPGHDDDPDLPDEPPLPDPLPERAFGHIRPDSWLAAISVPVDTDDGEGSVYAISAKVVDVPLDVLPGRQKEFTNFVGKVIFGSDGAIAGMLGSAAVTVTVEGLPLHGPNRKAGEIVLDKLPFQGNVHIGKNSLLRGEDVVLQDILLNLGLSD